MKKNIQTVSIRLLQKNKIVKDAVRDGVVLSPWDKFPHSLIALDTVGGNSPKWTNFLELTEDKKKKLFNRNAYGLVFLKNNDRWFAISFGLGHVKLNYDAFEQDFGLRVVLNTVDPKKLRSADIRTPDENTTSRRMQTARRSDQSVFTINIERDIMRGLSGEPNDAAFARRVSGSDALILSKSMQINDLPRVCAEALEEYNSINYQANFAWIDQIQHVRNNELINKLDFNLIVALNIALSKKELDTLQLVYPVIYNPEKTKTISYTGFRNSEFFPDLEISDYIDALKNKEISEYIPDFLKKHKVCECNDEGKNEGNSWNIRECLSFETELDNEKYVLSAGRWYLINNSLSRSVEKFFEEVKRYNMPAALKGENETQYNSRIANNEEDLLCLDKKLVKPSGALSEIEVCDFLAKDGTLIHVKNETSSSRLSHLFNQGTVSARVMKIDGSFRDLLRERIKEQESCYSKSGYHTLISNSTSEFFENKHLIVYAVLTSKSKSEKNRLPFFSLITFRQAADELAALGFKCAFSWVTV